MWQSQDFKSLNFLTSILFIRCCLVNITEINEKNKIQINTFQGVCVCTEEGRATVFFSVQNFELFHYCLASYFCLRMNIGGGKKVVGGGEPFRERLIIVLKKTAFLVNLFPHPNSLTPSLIVDGKLSNPINSTGVVKVPDCCQAGLSENPNVLC